MNLDLFHPFTTLKTDDCTLFFHGACCNRSSHLYTTTAPSCCIPALYCHLSATLQTTSIIVVNLQDNRAVFRIFIALLKISLTPLVKKEDNSPVGKEEGAFSINVMYRQYINIH